MKLNVFTTKRECCPVTGHSSNVHYRHTKDIVEIEKMVDSIQDMTLRLHEKTGYYRNSTVVLNELDFMFIRAYVAHTGVGINGVEWVQINVSHGKIRITMGECKFPAFIDGIYEKN